MLCVVLYLMVSGSVYALMMIARQHVNSEQQYTSNTRSRHIKNSLIKMPYRLPSTHTHVHHTSIRQHTMGGHQQKNKPITLEQPVSDKRIRCIRSEQDRRGRHVALWKLRRSSWRRGVLHAASVTLRSPITSNYSG